MGMRLKNILLVVSDIESSKRFYHDLFGLIVVRDFGENAILSDGLVLQEQKTWEQLIHAEIVSGNAYELFFEESDFDAFLCKVQEHNACVAADPVVNAWGKRCIRLKDPDGHLIEVAER